MRVLFVTPEAHPLAKSGGLADVSAALPLALRRQGADARIIMPAYPCALAALKNARVEMRLAPVFGVEDGALISGQMPGSLAPVWLVHSPSLYARSGGLYQDEHGQDWPDNALRFAYFSRIAADVAGGFVGWTPDVVHANDWHTGLVPLFLAQQDAPAPTTVFTIHNLAFQGNFSREIVAPLGLPDDAFRPDNIEFYGQASFLKAAIRYCDRLTTVSPTYAREVLTADFGCGLDGCLRARQADFTGILNGIDDESWNPATDRHIAQPFSARDIAGKRLCKFALQRACGLPVDPAIPVVGFVSRITHQKMADILLEALPAIARSGAQLVLLGNGDRSLERAFERVGADHPEALAIRIGYDEVFAHALQAGADVLLAPARYEPCGLTQIYAMQYGTVPVVRRTGGLADTVTDATAATLADRTATGFAFDDVSARSLLGALGRALAAYHEPLTWRRLQLEGMSRDSGWKASATAYLSLYRDAAGLGAPAFSVEPAEAAMQVAAS